MTLNAVIALILRAFSEFDRFLGRLYHSGWRQTYNVHKILSSSSSLLILAKTITHPAARSLCDSWASCLLTQIGRYAFLKPHLGHLGNVRRSSHWKARSGLPISVIDFFSLGVTAEALRAIIVWKSAYLLQRAPVDPKFQVQGVALHQPFFFSEN